jgi:predicted O-methyltransferase YrrM
VPEPPFPDRFPDVRAAALRHAEEHRCEVKVPEPGRAQAVAVLARLSRASHVLVCGSDPAYTPIHIAAALGLTGRIDLVDPDEHHAVFAQRVFTQHGFTEKLKVVEGRAVDVVPYLNGPYDLVVAGPFASLAEPLRSAVYRLLRAGGALVVDLPEGDSIPPAVAEFGADERWMFGRLGHFAVAVKLR